MPKLTLILCTYNRQRFIKPTLESIRCQNFNDYEVVFIDNNSPDNTAEIIRAYQERYPQFPMRYFLEKEQGLSHARNRGIIEAEGSILCFIDDDVILFPDFVGNLVRFFEDNPEVKAAGGRTIPRFEEGKPSWLTPWLEPLFACMDLGNEEIRFTGKKHPFGANMAFRAEIFLRFGGFNTQLGRKGRSMAAAEEKDFFGRLKRAEEPIYYVPGATLYHIMPAERCSSSYIKRQAVGIGVTERIISKGSLGRWLSSFFSEQVKTWGSLLLAIAYLCTGRTAAAVMLIRFRFWVWRGFLSGKEI